MCCWIYFRVNLKCHSQFCLPECNKWFNLVLLNRSKTPVSSDNTLTYETLLEQITFKFWYTIAETI